MNLYATSPESLWSSPSFLRFAAYSGVAHVGVALFVLYGSFLSFRSDMPLPEPVMITVMDAPPEPVPDPAPEPVPPEPPAPEPEPPKPPEPEVKPPEPEPPQQTVDEAVVIPEVPRDKPKPPPKKKPDPKPKPPKPVDVADLMNDLRKNVEERAPKPQATSATSGTVDPELAEYYRKVKACLNANWVGASLFGRRRDLSVLFEVEVEPGGKVRSVEVTTSSGQPQLDETAERAIYKCSPLPEAPGGRTTIPIRFSPGDIE